MAERKPAGVPFESWFDKAIREATDRGEFDDLPGAGKPIPDLGTTYDEAWWAKQLLRREGLSLLPDTLQLQLVVEKERERIGGLESEADVRLELAALNEMIRQRLLSAVTGPPSRTTLVDVERFVAEWRRRGAEPGAGT